MASQQDIRIRLKGYDHTVLESSVRNIVDTARKSGAIVKGPVPLPSKVQRVTVLTSPHKDQKTGRDQYELRTHKRIILLKNPTDKTMDALMKLELAAGVDVQIAVK